MMTSELESLLTRALAAGALTANETACLFDAIMAGSIADPDVERLLRVVAERGETVADLVGAATAMRRHATPLPCDFRDAIDTCGTGGDGISTFNVSTVSAIIIAACGVRVAKHGNRSFTRKSGSAEVLAQLGVNIEASPESVCRCLRHAGIGFLYAARFHPAMARVAEIRRRVGTRTIFNLLGPLTNPAGARRQIIGVPKLEWMDLMARTLSQLGADHAMVVHGHDGLCDFSATGPSRYIEVVGDQISTHAIAPSDLGLKQARLDDLLVSGPAESAGVIRDILAGKRGPCRDHAVFNAAAGLIVAGASRDWNAAARLAERAIDDSAAQRTLDQLVKASNEAD